ncbi:MAG TPA: 7TM diverse intracellular signaling domain-containing protein [Ramlibacter sp.]
MEPASLPIRSWWQRLARCCVAAWLLPLLAAAGLVPAGLALKGVQYWPDATGTAAFAEARAALDQGRGLRAEARRVMPLGPRRAVWYRLDMERVAQPQQAVLTLPLASIDLVELFRPDGNGGWQVQRAGDALPVGEWPVRYLHPAFAFTLQPQAEPVAYLRVQHSHPVSIQWTLRDAGAFNEANKLWHLLLGGYVGFLLLVVVLAAAHAVLWRDSIHLYYGGHVILVGLVVLSLTGLAGEYLWPWNAWWNDVAPAVLAAAALGGIGLFVRELVAERGRRLLSWILLLLAAGCFVVAAAYLAFGRERVFLVHNANSAVSLTVFVAAVAWYAARHPKVGGWVLAGLAALAIGAVFPLLRNLGLEPPVAVTQYGLQAGAALQIPLVLIGLYFRSRERRDNQLRVHALARTDPLTGVGSHRVLLEGVEQLLARHRRDPLAGAVLRLRVSNLAAIGHEYGREAAEAALVRAAECVAHEAREGDTVAREQGGDLVLVLEGRMSREQAAATGRNIIAGGLKFSGRLPAGVTLSLHVAGLCAPFPPGNAQLLLGALGQMLQDIAADPGGRAMRIMSGGEVADSGRGEPGR